MRDEEGISWPVLFADLDGSNHQVYTELPNHIFLIDREGNVAFRGEFAHALSLHEALTQLEAQDGVGSVFFQDDRSMHMLGVTAFGWRGPQRGVEVSKGDIVKRAPPFTANLKMDEMVQALFTPLPHVAATLPP